MAAPRLINRYDPDRGQLRTNVAVAEYLGRHMVEHPYRCAKEDRRFYIDWFTGVRCPVGLLFSSKVYLSMAPFPNDEGQQQRWHEAVEGLGIYSDEVNELIERSIGWVPDTDMLYAFQQVHDNYLPHLWLPELAKVQRDWARG